MYILFSFFLIMILLIFSQENVPVPSIQPWDKTTFPSVFKQLKVTRDTIKFNIRENSYAKVLDMVNLGFFFITKEPEIQGRNEVLISVRSQVNCDTIYNVVISPRLLMTFKAKRDFFKNYQFKCSCDDFAVIVSILC